MTSRFSVLFTSTALTVALGLPALAAIQTQGNAQGRCSGVCAAVFGADDLSVPLVRVSGEDEDDEDCDEEEDEDDDDACTGALGAPAPAGTVAPPANGLFGNGAAPVAVTN
ncbi:hypothetical protein [Tabrizicola fusiformis]|uniref:hypothetical protein n=1 Tax=Tabrizicola sp. SY72 TaxID=2741673 RepID=UPI001572FBE7|nr:hypothetical protein [Tabrizicola sp. SY72]NTT85269.1 hypothetical protein [Tabrizicola sp. SY72]